MKKLIDWETLCANCRWVDPMPEECSHKEHPEKDDHASKLSMDSETCPIWWGLKSPEQPTGEEWGAAFSPCRTYRYDLWRVWSPRGGKVAFIGLNPSTADEYTNDPTIRRCIGFAKKWGYGGMHMLNIFAYRATDPKVLKQWPTPAGPENDRFLYEIAKSSDLVVCAWGSHGEYLDRGVEVAQYLTRSGIMLHCLKKTKGGHPGHPLYLRGDLEPFPYQPEMGKAK